MVPHPQRLVLIIGAMKSGTTSLFDLLASHPEVAASRIKEPEHFVTPRAHEPAVDADARYFALWPRWDATRHAVALEASTAYTMAPRRQGAAEAAARFASRTGVELRIIYMMREPLARIESHFRHAASRGTKGASRREMFEHAVAVSSYARQLEPWARCFGREKILLLSFEAFRDAGDETLADVCRFVGIDASHRFERVREARNVSWPPAVARMEREPWFGTLWKSLPKAWRRRAKTLAAQLLVRRRPYLSPREREEARRALRAEVLRLRSDYGFDTSRWL